MARRADRRRPKMACLWKFDTGRTFPSSSGLQNEERGRGGLSAKLRMAARGLGLPVRFALIGGQPGASSAPRSPFMVARNGIPARA